MNGDCFLGNEHCDTPCKCCLSIFTNVKVLIINRDSSSGVFCRCFTFKAEYFSSFVTQIIFLSKHSLGWEFVYFGINHKNYNFLDCDLFKKLLFQVVIGQFVIGQFNKPITLKVIVKINQSL